MAFIIEKPEDYLKFRIGDLTMQNILMSAEVSALLQENARLRAVGEKPKEESSAGKGQAAAAKRSGGASE